MSKVTSGCRDAGFNPGNVCHQRIRRQTIQDIRHRRWRPGEYYQIGTRDRIIGRGCDQREGLEAPEGGNGLWGRVIAADFPAGLSEAQRNRGADEARPENAGSLQSVTSTAWAIRRRSSISSLKSSGSKA